MKTTHISNRLFVAGVLTALAVSVGNAQTAPPSGQKTLAATMDVYVFPSAGQTPETQSKDEAACYQWAVQNTGTDPFELNKQSQQQAQQTQQAQRQAQQVGTGAGVAGAARGAAAGALIGEIASDNAGKGAAWGAAAGLVAGRRRARMAQSYAQNEVTKQGQQAQQATGTQLSNFKKAFSVCLEAKKYMVKY
jgi:predicted MFS family arabinose efflux permease